MVETWQTTRPTCPNSKKMDFAKQENKRRTLRSDNQ